LRWVLEQSSSTRRFITIVGDARVGNSLSVQTTLRGIVIQIYIVPGTPAQTIVDNALRAIVNRRIGWHSLDFCARRTIFWYKMLSLGSSPIICINAFQRSENQKHAEIKDGAQLFIDDYKVRVVLDGNSDSLDNNLLKSPRNEIIGVPETTKSKIRAIEEFQKLFFLMKNKPQLQRITFLVLGDIPEEYAKLLQKIQNHQGKMSAIDIIKNYLCYKFHIANGSVQQNKTENLNFMTTKDPRS
jgi:hypothetical protein